MRGPKKLILGIFVGGLMVFSSWPVCAERTDDQRLLNPHRSDQFLCHQIHNTIVADDSLPYCAHVMNVHAVNGVVTLKGLVHTPEELEKVRRKAAEFVGDDNVITDIRVQKS